MSITHGWFVTMLSLLAVLALASMGWALRATPSAAEGEPVYDVMVQFNESVAHDDLEGAGAILRAYDEGVIFLIRESFPPTGHAVLTTTVPDFCPEIERQLEAKTYVADVACGEQIKPPPSADQDDPVQQVVGKYTSLILGIDGVAGIGAGVCDSDPCIKVLLEEDTPELRQHVPEALGGYKVALEVTGPIEAQDDSWASSWVKAGLAIAGLAAVILMAVIGCRLWAVRRASAR